MIGNRYIAIMDILGFKNMVKELDLLIIVDKIKDLLKIVENYQSSLSWARIEAGNLEKVSIDFHFNKMHFSDMIVFWTKPFFDTDFDYEHAITWSFLSGIANLIFCGFIRNIPLRAGISFGESYIDIDNGIIAGQAIIDAYLTESAQDWVGGAVHPKCPINRISEDFGSPLIKYQVPIKDDKHLNLEFALDWISLAVMAGERKFEGYSYQEILEKTFNNYLNTYREPKIKKKYLNAKKFYEFQLERNPKKLIH